MIDIHTKEKFFEKNVDLCQNAIGTLIVFIISIPFSVYLEFHTFQPLISFLNNDLYYLIFLVVFSATYFGLIWLREDFFKKLSTCYEQVSILKSLPENRTIH